MNKLNKKGTKKRRNDLLLILVIMVAAAAGVFFISHFKTPGGTAVVTIDGKEVMSLPLSQNTEVNLGEDGHRNLLVIKDGKASITEASCPDHVCINRGEIQYEGETIVCLPNKLVVTIKGGEQSENDAVSQ